MDARRPSEIFLTLWRYRSQTDREETPGDFELCAEAWARIRELEQMAERIGKALDKLMTAN